MVRQPLRELPTLAILFFVFCANCHKSVVHFPQLWQFAVYGARFATVGEFLHWHIAEIFSRVIAISEELVSISMDMSL
jgi:hypothetical protein